jgi:hypothetical protein
MAASKQQCKVTRKITKIKQSRAAVDDSDEDVNAGVPLSDITRADEGLVGKVMAVTEVFLDMWLGTKSKSELDAMLELNANEKIHVSARMHGYANFINEMARLNQLDQSITRAKNHLLEKFLESYASKYGKKHGVISHKTFKQDLNTKLEILKDRNGRAAGPADVPVPRSDIDPMEI